MNRRKRTRSIYRRSAHTRLEMLEQRRLLVASADVSLPSEVRGREVAELTLNSFTDIDVNELVEFQVDWGDGRRTVVPAADLTLPVSLLHTYFADPSGSNDLDVQTSALLGTGQTLLLSTGSLSVVGNSPAVVNRSDDGLAAEIFASVGEDFDFNVVADTTRIDPTIAFDFGSQGPDPGVLSGTDSFAIRWSGTYLPDATIEHSFYARSGENDQVRVLIDGVSIIDTFGAPTATEQVATVPLTDGVPVGVVVEYVSGVGDSRIEVGVETQTSFKTKLPSHLLTPSVSSQQLRSGVLLEQFPVESVASIADLRSSSAFIQNTPIEASDATSFAFADIAAGDDNDVDPDDDSEDDLTDDDDDFSPRATRMRGLLRAPTSGEYFFYLAASDVAELWLSQGASSDNSQLITSVSIPTDEMGFSDVGAGVSAPVYLHAGQDYYIETLSVHDDESSAAHASVGWAPTTPADAEPVLIDAASVRPITPQVTIQSDVSQTHEWANTSLGASVVVTRSDDLGRDLEVAYTLGGDAQNGLDYEPLSGIVTIPLGQRSTTIELKPIDDSIAESSEQAILRLAARSEYQLGAEHQRQSVLTIAGEVNAGTDLLPADFAGVLSEANTIGALPNTFATAREDDTSLPFVDAVGDNYFRVAVNDFVNPWDVRVLFDIENDDLPDNEQVFASVWARSAIAGETALVGQRLEEVVAPYLGVQQTWEVSDQWTPIVWPVVTDFGGDVIDRTFDIRLGYQTQTVDLAGFGLITFSGEVDADTLPQKIYDYDGRAASAVWRQDASTSAQQLRTQPADITILDSMGEPVADTLIEIIPETSSFQIGTTVTPERLFPITDPFTQTEDSLRYREIASRFYDSLTDGGTAQWSSWLDDQVVPTTFANWVTDQGLPYHGHSVIWGMLNEFPAPAFLQNGYDQIVADEGLAAGEAWLESELLNHIASGPTNALSGTRPNSSDPIVTWWDVVNHPVLDDDIWQIVGTDFINSVIDATSDVVNPSTQLIINEDQVVADPGSALADGLFDLLTELDQLAADGRAGFDIIGFQSHFQSTNLPSIDQIAAELVRFSSFDRDIQITEFDVDSFSIDQQTQADFTRDFFSTLRATEQVTLATIWGFWQQEHWRSSEFAEWFTDDWVPRLNGQWFLDQRVDAFETTRFTTDDDGRIRTNVGAGELLIKITGVDEPISASLAGRPVTIQLPPPPNIAPVISSDGGGATANVDVPENQVEVTTVIASDENLGDVVSFSLTGGANQGLFDIDQISGVLTQKNAADFETDPGPFEVQVTAADLGGLQDSQLITVNILDVIDTPNQFVVNTVNDTSDVNPGDGVAVDADGMTSLRAAIEEANATGNNPFGRDEILFDIPGLGPHVIELQASLPAIAESVDIQGASEPDFDGLPVVGIDGSQTGTGIDGLRVTASTVSISGLAIYGFASDGIDLAGGGDHEVQDNHLGLDLSLNPIGNQTGLAIRDSSNNLIGGNVVSGNRGSGITIVGETATQNVLTSNLVGTDPSGQTAMPNQGLGILVNGPDNFIGQAGNGNLVSGNGSVGISISVDGNGTTLHANRVGTDVTGNTKIANGSYGVLIRSSGNLIGGDSLLGQGNQFSGNARHGLILSGSAASNNEVYGNLIGTIADGSASLGNEAYGIYATNESGNTIGSVAAGEANIVSGNGRSGIALARSNATTIIGNRIGTNADGSAAVPNNAIGVYVISDSTNNTIRSNQIAGNSGTGVAIIGADSSGNVIADNLLGTNATGTSTISNGNFAALIASPNNLIGGSVEDGNTIAGSVRGIVLSGVTATGNTISHNHIGTNESLQEGLGMATGVQFANQATGNVVGPNNTIAFNGTGIRLLGNSGSSNSLTQNVLVSNESIGIDLAGPGATPNDIADVDEGPNRSLNHPVISSAEIVGGEISVEYLVPVPTAAASYPLTIEFFRADAFGQGEVFIGGDTYEFADAESLVTSTLTASAGIFPGDFVSATATDAAGNTSEFSGAVAIGTVLLEASSSLNARSRLDVSQDGSVTAIDALMIVNNLNAQSLTAEGEFASVSPDATKAMDTNDDGVVSAMDALVVINWINRSARFDAVYEESVLTSLIDSVLSDLDDDDTIDAVSGLLF